MHMELLCAFFFPSSKCYFVMCSRWGFLSVKFFGGKCALILCCMCPYICVAKNFNLCLFCWYWLHIFTSCYCFWHLFQTWRFTAFPSVLVYSAVFNGVIWLFILLDILIFNERMVGNFALIHFKVIGTSLWIFKAVTAGINDLSKKGWYCRKWCVEMYFFDWKYYTRVVLEKKMEPNFFLIL